MAKRYSGNLQISVIYDDRGDYRTTVSREGKMLWRGRVNPAPAGFGRGVAYDSPEAYDQIAKSALSFADHEKPDAGIGDDADSDPEGAGWAVRRSPSDRSTTQRGRRKTGAVLEGEIQQYLRTK